MRPVQGARRLGPAMAEAKHSRWALSPECHAGDRWPGHAAGSDGRAREGGSRPHQRGRESQGSRRPWRHLVTWPLPVDHLLRELIPDTRRRQQTKFEWSLSSQPGATGVGGPRLKSRRDHIGLGWSPASCWRPPGHHLVCVACEPTLVSTFYKWLKRIKRIMFCDT